MVTRSPSGALLPTFFWGGFPNSNRLQKKVGTLILTSLLEDLGDQSFLLIIGGRNHLEGILSREGSTTMANRFFVNATVAIDTF